jgi:hypothetical protein
MANGITRFIQPANISCKAYYFTLPNQIELNGCAHTGYSKRECLETEFYSD